VWFYSLSTEHLHNKEKIRHYLLISFIIILPFSFYTHFSSLFGEDSVLSRKMILLAKEMNVNYKSWNWPENLEDNGMAMHVVMTSSRKSAPLAKEGANKSLI
jgi:hypothetical protein